MKPQECFQQAGITNALDGSEDNLLASDLKVIWDHLDMGAWRQKYIKDHPQKITPMELLRCMETTNWGDFEPSKEEVCNFAALLHTLNHLFSS